MSPKEIVQQYNLKYLVTTDVYVCMEIRKGMPGLKQDVRLVIDRLTKILARNAYAPVPHTSSLWSHHTSDLVFSIVVDNFGINYTQRESNYHLLRSLREDDVITNEWTGEK